ncbi:Spo11/DNA topoisomerase VI subunit A [Mycotypha africana]|uniref:Spo11/DNA topoisomerase VI subunit A n=1 Tax=Mycotypha africana TaxID=64632 RepID=UPI002300A21C|nr:Spo11/DNA topoisomerase VI subunit A [Mycotypha africana]KAI8982156.1 Spo11/DNA topoisomerase VI subunit A [Mycotypha africana]
MPHLFLSNGDVNACVTDYTATSHLNGVNKEYNTTMAGDQNNRLNATINRVLDHELMDETNSDIDNLGESSATSLLPNLTSTAPLHVGYQQLQHQRSTVEKSREELMSEIEQTVDQIMTSIMLGEVIRLPIAVRKLTTSSSSMPSSMSSSSSQQHNGKKSKAAIVSESNAVSSNGGHFEMSSQPLNTTILSHFQQQQSVQQTRILSLNCASSAKTLARYLSVLQMIYEAIAYKIMVTKRDMFYRDVSLFGTQSVVDIIVDDLSCHYNVPRSSLNVSAASKGLIFGPVMIKLKNNKVIDCMGGSASFLPQTAIDDTDGCSDEQGSLIPPINQIVEVQCKAKCMIIVEKEATFRYLVSVGFCQSLPQSCVLVTGKGYPDLSTRQFVKYFSTHFSRKPILALMDNDPHGLDIYATYKWGARAMAFDVLSLAVNSIKLLGLTCQDRKICRLAAECYIPMTDRDRSKCLSMIKTYNQDEMPGQSQLVKRGYYNLDEQLASPDHQEYINEVNDLLGSDYKCELQSLNHAGPYGLTEYLLSKLRKYQLL